eukprot:GSChrysophyteH1.ASY1.ANO1.2648.1 assembled CDS
MPVTTHNESIASSKSMKHSHASTKSGTHAKSHKSKTEKPSEADASIAEDPSLRLDQSSILSGKVFQKKIMGDVFGVNPEMTANNFMSLLYRSRVKEDDIEALSALGKGVRSDDYARESSKIKEQVDDTSVFEDNSDDEPESFEGLNSRQQLALTIRNWSSMPENDQYIIEEGAVHALIGLAVMDDNFIKKCSAKAMENMSSREENREHLLQLGAAMGVIQIAMSTRDYKIAKLCARTLCSLSMFQHGEAVMARDGAILALVILLGIKGSRLLPVAAQSLYNLTCIAEHFKGVERTVKAFLALPSSMHDTSGWFLKSLVNCCRFSWIRMRIIEDGALAGVAAVVPTLSSKENSCELVEYIAVSIRLLSESVGCRIELLAKGALNILEGIIPFSNEKSRVLIAKALHNINQHPLSNIQFSLSANIACRLASSSKDAIVMEYVSACFQSFASEGLRNDTSLANIIMDSLPLCLKYSSRPLTQYYSVSTAGNLFFMKNTDNARLETLIEQVISLGDTINDPEAMQALAIAFAKLTQDEFSMAILEKKSLFPGLLKLTLELLKMCGKELIHAMESCPIAICRVTLKLGSEKISQEDKKEIAVGLLSLLQSEHLFVLGNAICAIRALSDAGISQKEFLENSNELFSRLAVIVREHGGGNLALSRNCCALIAGFSYMSEAHAGLSKPDVMEMLFVATKSDDTVIRELVANTICNMTVSAEASSRLIESGVCEIVATLSGATSEDIQNLCAKCICNLTCAVDRHDEIISHGVLQTILLIALVRTVEDKTKLLCARAVMNLLSDKNIDALKEAGVIRVFASIAAVLNHSTQIQCAQGFLIFSVTEARRDDVCSRRPVLQALFLMIKSTSQQCRILVGMTVCNLLSCPKSQKLAIAAGALQVLKIISTMEYPQLREASARVIINLMRVKALYPALLLAPIVPISSDSPSSGHIFDCAVHAMSCVSQAEQFRESMYAKGGVAALVTSVLLGKVQSSKTATEVVRTLCLLSYRFDETPQLIENQVILAMLVLYRSGHIVPESAEMITIMIRNCSTVASCRDSLLHQGAILLMRGLQRPMVDRSIAIARSIIIAAAMFSLDESNHDIMAEHGIVQMIYDIVYPTFGNRTASDEIFPVTAAHSFSKFQINAAYEQLAKKKKQESFSLSSLDMERLSKACKNLSTTCSVHRVLVDGRILSWVEKFLTGPIEDTARHNIATALCNISASKNVRQTMVEHNANELLLNICKDTESMSTKSQCQIALSNLSEITRVSNGAVSSLLELTVTKEDDAENGTKTPQDSNEMHTGESVDDVVVTSGSSTDEKIKKPSKSLRQMIRDGLLSSKNKATLKRGGSLVGGVLTNNSIGASEEASPEIQVKKGRSLLVGRLRNITAHDMDTADSIAREKDGLKTDYTKFEYTIYANFDGDFGVEQGGKAAKHKASLGLPTILRHREVSASNTGSVNSGLTKLEISLKSLAKDTRILDIDAMAEAVAIAEREAEEREIAAQAEAARAEEELEKAGSGRGSPTPGATIDETEGGRYSHGTKKKKPRLTKSPSSKGSVQQKVVKGAGAAWGGNAESSPSRGPGTLSRRKTNIA